MFNRIAEEVFIQSAIRMSIGKQTITNVITSRLSLKQCVLPIVCLSR